MIKAIKILTIISALLIPATFVFTQVEHGKAPSPAQLQLINRDGMLRHETGKVKPGAGLGSAADGNSASDHRAEIFEFQGDVRILKKGTKLWLPVRDWMVVEAGDKLRAGPDSFIRLVYDDAFLNIAEIGENTMAEFRSIEPTDLFLSDGTIFSAVDGLNPGDRYQISTPVAVAAVRGTHFEVMFNAENNHFSAATFPVPEDAHESMIEIQAVMESGPEISLSEGKQLDVSAGEIMSEHLIRDLNPEKAKSAKNVFAQMKERIGGSEKGNQKAEKTVAVVSHREASNPNQRQDPGNKVAGNGPSDGGDVGNLQGQNNGSDSFTAMTVTAPSLLQGAARPVSQTFSADRFVDKILETDSPAPVTEMQKLTELEIHGSSPQTSEDPENPSPSFSGNQMLEFIKVGGVNVNDPETRDEAVDAMRQLMESSGVSEEKIDSFIDKYNEGMDDFVTVSDSTITSFDSEISIENFETQLTESMITTTDFESTFEDSADLDNSLSMDTEIIDSSSLIESSTITTDSTDIIDSSTTDSLDTASEDDVNTFGISDGC